MSEILKHNSMLQCKTCKMFADPEPTQRPLPGGGKTTIICGICRRGGQGHRVAETFQGCLAHTERRLK